jgi:DNA-directed RNA polymerase subunit beta'
MYYLTMENKESKGSGRILRTMNEAISSYQSGESALHARVIIPAKALNKTCFTPEQQNALFITTVGKLIMNEIFPTDFPYINEPTKVNLLKGTPDKYFIHDKGADLTAIMAEMPEVGGLGKDYLGSLIAECFRVYHTTQTSMILDKIKELGIQLDLVLPSVFLTSWFLPRRLDYLKNRRIKYSLFRINSVVV